MPNTINKTGITTKTYDEILNELKQGFYGIYGDNVTFEQDSPDGQMLNIFTLAVKDILQYGVSIYNSFDPDIAIGTSLDERCAYNGVVRKAGTYTIIPINITIKAGKTITLQGLNNASNEYASYTISDRAGNKFYLMNTETFVAGNENTTFVRSFRAVKKGVVDVALNTVTVPITQVLGVASVNNTATEIVIGSDTETDESLRTRRAKAVGYTIAGSVEVLQASIRDLEDVSNVVIYENTTNETVESIPAHSIWAIVEGGENEKIANCIYLRLNAGCGMKGSVSVSVPTIYGNTQTIKFDRPINENLYIRFRVTKENILYQYEGVELINYLIDNYVLGLSEPSTTTDVNAVLKAGDANLVYTGIEISKDGTTWNGTLLDTLTKQHKFVTDYNRAYIVEDFDARFTYTGTSATSIDTVIANVKSHFSIDEGEDISASDIKDLLEEYGPDYTFSNVEIKSRDTNWTSTSISAYSDKHKFLLNSLTVNE